MSSGGGRKAASPGGEEAEVEALIRAAQDAVLLKLQANSHLVSSTSASVSAPTPMSGGGVARNEASTGREDAEVEALIRAAQDAVLLKLQANAHLVSSNSASAPTAPLDDVKAAPDPLDDDLARRFDALRSRAAAAPKPKAAEAGAAPSGIDDLEARFAALKRAAGPEKEARVKLEDLEGESEEDEADEVDKLMRWAMDAARLDVATAGAGDNAKRDGEEEEEKDEKSSVSSEGSEEDDDDDDERLRLEMARKRKEMEMAKSMNKWFL